MSGQVEERIRQLGHDLRKAPEAVGSYVPVLQMGNLVITSGQLPFVGKTLAFKGKIGAQLHEDDGFNAAEICALNAISQIKACIGDLEKVKRIVRVEGYVNSAPGFKGQPNVLNGASQLFVGAFGDKGRHTRIAVGVHEMPLDAAVQLAVWAEVE